MSIPVQPPRPPRNRRGPLRRYLETRGVLGGHRVPHYEARLMAGDGTRLAASFLPGPPGATAAILLAHGFAANRLKPSYARLADGLSAVAPVLSLDLRGHGGSEGASTFGDAEAADVRAGLHWLRASGYAEVVGIGASMGATAVLHAAAADGERPPVLPTAGPRAPRGDSGLGAGDAPQGRDRSGEGRGFAALVLVSAPAVFRAPAPPGPLQRLETLWHSRTQRRLLRAATGVRVAPPSAWTDPSPPTEWATRVLAPLLVVHGADDAYFPIGDAHALVAAAGGPAVLWEEPAGFGHAEDGFSAAFVRSLVAAVGGVLAEGRFPERLAR